MSIFSELREGRLPSFPIIDCHGHAGPFHGLPIPSAWADGMLRTMDAAGIERLVFAPDLAIGPDPEEGNRIAGRMNRDHPSRLLPYCTVGPHQPESVSRGMLEEYVASGWFVGIKLHPSLHRAPVTDPGYDIAFRYAEEYQIPVLVHTWEPCGFSSPDLVAQAAARHPEAPVILAHSAGAHAGMARVIQLAQRHANLWVETSGSSQPWRALERLCEGVGVDRVLFGSDLPFLDPRPKLGAVCLADLSDDAKRAILHDNAERLFRLGDTAA